MDELNFCIYLFQFSHCQKQVLQDPSIDEGYMAEEKDNPLSKLLTILHRLRRRPKKLQ